MADSPKAQKLSPFALAFATAMKQWRTDKGLSQAALAGRMQEVGFDFHQQTIYNIERGGRAVSFDEAHALGNILGFSPEALLEAGESQYAGQEAAANAFANAYGRQLAFAHVYLKRAKELQKRFERSLQEAESAGFVAASGLTGLRSWEGLDEYLASYQELASSKAGWWLMGHEESPRALEEQAFDYQTELEDDGH